MWPSRAITSRSVTARPEQKFLVAVAARNGRGDDAEHDAPQRGDRRGDGRTHLRLHQRIADDAFLELAASGFEARSRLALEGWASLRLAARAR